jgi:AcrR family transcriptional regulator
MAGKRMPSRERREQILQTAVELFAKRGFAEVTTREIAGAANINEATIYKHFASKEELFDAVVSYFGNQVVERTKAVEIQLDEDLRSNLTTIASNVIRYVREDPKIMRLMLYSALQEHSFAEDMFRQSLNVIFQKTETLIRSNQEEGKVRKDIDPYYAALSFIGVLVYFNLARTVVLKRVFSHLDEETFIRHVVDIFLKGISKGNGGER